MNAETTERHANRRLWINILQLSSGTVISQVIVLFTTPVLTRYYSPHDFGVAAFFFSFLAFLAPLSTLNYYQAIILPQVEQDSLRLGRLCIIISLGIFPLFLMLFYFLSASFDSLFKMPELVTIFWLFPTAILIRSMYLIFAAHMARCRAFALQSKARISRTIIDRLISLVTAIAGHASSLVLVFARFASFTIETALLIFAFMHRSKTRVREATNVKTTSELAREYRHFPLYSSWAMLLANGSSQLPLFLLPLLFTPVIGGFFALGNRLIQIPMQFVGESIRTVYYKEVTDQIHQGREKRSGFVSLRDHLVAAGMFPFFFLLLFGKSIFGFIFGPEWIQAGNYAGILGFYFFFQFISSPIVCIFNAFNKQKYLLFISFLLFSNNLLSILFGSYLRSPTKGFIILAFNGILIYMLMNFLAEKIVGARHSEQFSTYAKYLAYNIPFVTMFFLIKGYTENVTVILSSILILTACYYTLIFRHKFAATLMQRVKN